MTISILYTILYKSIYSLSILSILVFILCFIAAFLGFNKETTQQRCMKKSTKRFVLSDETKNLHGFITVTAGIDLSDFANNPVMLYDHDYGKLIGLWADWKIEGTKLTAVPMFDEEDPYAMLQLSKVEQGILNGVSIGIAPIQFDEVNSKMDLSSLKEASLTPVPSNRKALSITLYDQSGIKLSDKQAKEYLLSLHPKTEDLTQKQNMNQNLITALVALCVQAGHTINLSSQSSDAEVELALKKVGEKITSLSSVNSQLTVEVTTYKDAAAATAKNEVDTLIATAIADKRLSADQKPAFEALGAINLAALKTSLTALKPVSVVDVPGAKEQAEVAGRESWSYDQFALSAPDELATMQRKDTEKFQKLLSAKQQAVRAGGSIAL